MESACVQILTVLISPQHQLQLNALLADRIVLRVRMSLSVLVAKADTFSTMGLAQAVA